MLKIFFILSLSFFITNFTFSQENKKKENQERHVFTEGKNEVFFSPAQSTSGKSSNRMIITDGKNFYGNSSQPKMPIEADKKLPVFGEKNETIPPKSVSQETKE